MQKGPISIENKDNYFSENTFVNKAEQENLIPVGMSKSPEPNTGNHCISQDHNILQADTSNNILKQKNGGELISSDSNQNFSCPIVGFIHDTSLQKKIENTKQIETELKDTCIDKEPYVQSYLLNSKKGNSEDNSCTDAGDSNEVLGKTDVQEDENSISFLSCIDSANSTSVPFALNSSSEGDDYGTTMAQDSGQFIQFSKEMGKIVKEHKSRKKKKRPLGREEFSYTWKLKDNCDIENYRNIYEIHVSWLKSLKNRQISVKYYKEYVLLVRIESCVAVAFNKIKNSLLEGVSCSNLCESIAPHSKDFDISELEYILSHSPLYCKMNDVWKKCYAADGIKEENHWQGILYMRQILADIKFSSEDRYKIVKFFLSDSCDKSAAGLTKSICKGLHIPYCFDMVEKVLFTLRDLVTRKEVVRVAGGASSASGGQSPEEAIGKPSESTKPKSASPEKSTRNLPGLFSNSTTLVGQFAATVLSSSKQLFPSGNSSSLPPVKKCVISSEKGAEGLTQEILSSLQSSSTVAESENSNVRKSENSDECMPDQSVSDSTVSSVSVGELSQTTVSSFGEAQKTCGTANFSEKNVEQNLDEAIASGEQPIVNATTDVNSCIGITKVFGKKEENEVTKEPSVKQDIPIPKGKQTKKDKIISNCSPKRRKASKGSVDDFFLPMAHGWVRELVKRSVVSTNVRCDVYYHPPDGRKLRSIVEIGRYLSARKITHLTSKNFTFGKTPLGLGPPYELIRNANVAKNYFKRKVNDTLSPETPAEENTPMKKLTETPVEENTPMKKLKLSQASLSQNLTSLTDDTKKKKKRKCKVKAPMNATLYPAAPASTDNVHSKMLNESGDDDVDITNEVGETTGYEGWFTSNPTNQSCTHTKIRPTETVKKILIKSKMAGSCSINKGQGVEATILSGILGKGSSPVKPSSSKSSDEISKGALSTGLTTATRITKVQSHSQNEGKIPNIISYKKNTISQDGGQVLKSPWLDIIDKYEKRKIIRERNSGKKMFDSMPVGVRRYSNLINKPVGTNLNLRPFPEPEPKSTTCEKSVSRIRVKCFSELADVPSTAKNLNCVSESIQSVPMQTPICSSSALGGKSLQPASGSGNSLVKRSSGHTDPQQPKPAIVFSFSSQNSCQVPKGSDPDLLAPVWHSPVLPVGAQVVVPHGSPTPVFGVSSPHPYLPYPSVNPTIRPENLNTNVASVTPMLPAASQIPRMQPLLLHNSLSSLSPTQQGTSHVTQVTSQPSVGTNFHIQNTRVNFQERTSQIQADTVQLSANTSHLHHNNTISTPTNIGSNVVDTGFGFYKELSTTDGNG